MKSKTSPKAAKSAAGSALTQREKTKPPKEKTGKKAASNASKTLKKKSSTKTEKSVAASALSQAEKPKAKGKKKK